MGDKAKSSGQRGFTLVELMVALVVTGIVLGAVATFAYAMGQANDSGDDTLEKQAQVRYATLRISELIRNCRLVCGSADDDLAIWRADDNGDGAINGEELVYIEAGGDRNYLQLLEFSTESASLESQTLQPADIASGSTKAWLKSQFEESYTVMVPECSDVEFLLDSAVPWTRFVSILFDVEENEVERHYEIDGTLRCWAGHLLSSDGASIVSDDD